MGKINVAIVGTGLIAGKKHLPAFLKLKKKIASLCLVDPNREAAQKLAQTFGIEKIYGSLSELLSKEKPDLIDICTPPRTHVGIALEALQAGCHVFVEKPMAMNVQECDQLIEASQKFRKKICVGHSDLFYPPFLKAREWVCKGAIGQFMGMKIFLSTPTDYMTSKENHWANKLPGGVIGESGPHVVYITLAFIPKILDVKVTGLKLLSQFPWSPYEDYRIELIGEKTSSSITSIYTTDQWAATVDLWGTEGLLKLDLELMTLVKYRRNSFKPSEIALSGASEASQLMWGTFATGLKTLMGRFKRTHELLIGKFVDAILNDSPSPVSAQEGREAVRVMDLIVEGLKAPVENSEGLLEAAKEM
ncbi:MAG: Gfo/Idh/MocA family oxidoreductase [Chlamydiae bacterium]|nr:Gfo/Idh/MocA family oxidoreductase [Chlamydiota bacterium]MBI3276192.1 Gfo/Idh/MocA family oxidoreductase [Chlamydiota bacterium]